MTVMFWLDSELLFSSFKIILYCILSDSVMVISDPVMIVEILFIYSFTVIVLWLNDGKYSSVPLNEYIIGYFPGFRLFRLIFASPLLFVFFVISALLKFMFMVTFGIGFPSIVINLIVNVALSLFVMFKSFPLMLVVFGGLYGVTFIVLIPDDFL